MTSTKLDNYTNLEDLPILPSTNTPTTFESTGGQRNPLDLRRPVKPKRTDEECQHTTAAAGGGGGSMLTRKNSGRLRNAELALANKLVRKNSGLLRKSDSDDALSVRKTIFSSHFFVFKFFLKEKRCYSTTRVCLYYLVIYQNYSARIKGRCMIFKVCL